eukprot:11467-Heterococcus_DN1.PRE.2
MKLLTLLVVALACSTAVLAQEAAAETSEVSYVPEDAYDSSQQIELADLPHKEDQSEHVISEEALHAVGEEVGTLLEHLEEESAEQPAADEPSSTSPVDVQNQEEQEEEEQDPRAAFSELPVAESDGIDWKAVAQAEKAEADQAKADLAAAKAEHQLKVDQFKADTAEIQEQPDCQLLTCCAAHALLQAMVRGMEVARCEEAMQKSQDQCEADVAAAGSDVSRRLEAARADLALALEAQEAANAELAHTKELQLEAEAARQAALLSLMHAVAARTVALHVVTHDCSCCEAVQAGVEQHSVVGSALIVKFTLRCMRTHAVAATVGSHAYETLTLVLSEAEKHATLATVCGTSKEEIERALEETGEKLRDTTATLAAATKPKDVTIRALMQDAKRAHCFSSDAALALA